MTTTEPKQPIDEGQRIDEDQRICVTVLIHRIRTPAAKLILKTRTLKFTQFVIKCFSVLPLNIIKFAFVKSADEES